MFRFLKKILWPLAVLAALGAGGIAGWYLKAHFTPSPYQTHALRSGGYQFTNPLLLCDAVPTNEAIENKTLEDALSAFISSEAKKNVYTTASVYVLNFANGHWAEVNGSEKYYPASMEKVPVMMAYLALAQSDPSILSRTITYHATTDANLQQEVPVKDAIVPGNTYTVLELIHHMIDSSDNNATELLFNNLDKSVFQDAFTELHIPFLAPGQPPTDFMTARDYSLFLRVLYNGTYLSHDLSEKALEILSQNNFDSGLTAGLPATTTIANKFGLVSVAPDGNDVTFRELHDCGIVYPGQKGPYLACVMTKGPGNLKDMEAGIAKISQLIYQNLN